MGYDFPLSNILSWVIFGVLVGLVANVVDPKPAVGGVLASVVFGILGAVAGGWIANMVFNQSVLGFNLTSFVVAVMGALLLMFIYKVLLRKEGRVKTRTTRLN